MNAPARAPSAEAVAEALVGRATGGARIETADQLRAIPAADLASAVEPLHLPVVDGVVVPDEPGILFARGAQHDVPFMTGGDRFDGSVMPRAGSRREASSRPWAPGSRRCGRSTPRTSR